MKLIYIAGRYRAKTEYEVDQNITHAKTVLAKLLRRGYAVVCPHTMTAHLGGVIPDRGILDSCLEILRRCDAIYMMKGWESSQGSQEELKLAQKLGLEVHCEL